MIQLAASYSYFNPALANQIAAGEVIERPHLWLKNY
jgi:DNA mismatch repair ATPase MutL